VGECVVSPNEIRRVVLADKYPCTTERAGQSPCDGESCLSRAIADLNLAGELRYQFIQNSAPAKNFRCLLGIAFESYSVDVGDPALKLLAPGSVPPGRFNNAEQLNVRTSIWKDNRRVGSAKPRAVSAGRGSSEAQTLKRRHGLFQV
jgi:hypothetical protein